LGKMIMGLVAAVALSVASPADVIPTGVRPPAMDISAIRQIRCPGWTGTGFIIAKGVMATANHVMSMKEKNCVDSVTGIHLIPFKSDVAHDLTLVTGDFPADIPYVKYSCERFKPGQPYLTYGVSSYKQNHTLMRNDVILATKEHTGKDFKFSDGMLVAGARIFLGYQVPGESGGPVTDIYGYAHGLVTGGNDFLSFNYEFADGILCK